MFSPVKFIFFFGILFAVFAASAFADESISIVSYYPSPYGSYNELYVADKLGIGTADGNPDAVPRSGPNAPLDIYGPDIDPSTNTGAATVLRLNRDVIGGGGYRKHSAVDFMLSRWQDFVNYPHTRLDIRLSGQPNDTSVPSIDVMSIRSDGNVGIGTTSPVARLHILGSSQLTLALDSPSYPELTFRVGGVIKSYDAIATGAGGYFTTSGIGDRIIRTEGGNILLGSGGTELIRITPAGNVGIGTTTASSKLHIYDSTTGSYTDNALKVETSSGYATFGSLNASWFHIATSLPQFYFNNPCQAVGGFSTYSSRDKKKDISHLSPEEEDAVLASLLKMQMTYYRYKDKRFDKKLHLGVIAEESPDQILTADKKAVEMMDYASYALAAIKAQQRQIDELKAEIIRLNERLR